MEPQASSTAELIRRLARVQMLREPEVLAYEVEMHLCACQGRPIKWQRESMTGMLFINLQCRSCGKKTRTFETEEEAIEEWNDGRWREL